MIENGSTKKKNNVPTLQDRIDAIHSEIDDLANAHADELKRQSPSIPRDLLKQMLLAPAKGCRCAELKIIEGKK